MRPAIGDDAPTAIRCVSRVTLEVVALGKRWVELRVVTHGIGEAEPGPPKMMRISLNELLTFEMPVTFAVPACGKVVGV